MESIFIDQLSTNHNEDVLCGEMDKKFFYSCLDFYNYEVDSVLHKKIFTEQKEEFNYVLRKIKEHFDIPIYKSILYLEKDFMSVYDLLNTLDETNIYTLKCELSKKHNKKMNINIMLKRFFTDAEE